ncbi:DinB family protein [Croceiramulus getboli]|nr:DinB family protein [Flavobacteriaceae bacterium YJPT1-3]
MKRNVLKPDEFNPYYGQYIDLVPESLSLLEALEEGKKRLIKFIREVPEDRLIYRYATGKWTIKEKIQHLLDTERVFVYRALRFSRKDQMALPGFEQDEYVVNSRANEREIEDLLSEYERLRDSTLAFFKSLSDEELKRTGVASGSPMSARAAGFICAGHEIHHCNLISARYL